MHGRLLLDGASGGGGRQRNRGRRGREAAQLERRDAVHQQPLRSGVPGSTRRCPMAASRSPRPAIPPTTAARWRTRSRSRPAGSSTRGSDAMRGGRRLRVRLPLRCKRDQRRHVRERRSEVLRRLEARRAGPDLQQTGPDHRVRVHARWSSYGAGLQPRHRHRTGGHRGLHLPGQLDPVSDVHARQRPTATRRRR